MIDTKVVRKRLDFYDQNTPRGKGGWVDSEDFLSLVNWVRQCCDEVDRLTAELERYKWIPVNERLPKVKDNQFVYVFAVNMNDNKRPFLIGYDNLTGFETREVTHWIYVRDILAGILLPPAPEVMG